METNDSQYRKDFENAMKLLSGPPPTWFSDYPTQIEPVHACRVSQIPVVDHPFDPDRVADVLARISIAKTSHPAIRLVHYMQPEGTKVLGRIAKNPYGIGWVADCDRRTMYSSQRSAALHLYTEWRRE